VREELSGVLNLDKPVGMTSHDAVAAMRRLTGQRGVGHAGTLDPLASGVVVMLLGRATALSAYAMASEKTYAAEVCFGVETSTEDAEGAITAEAPVPTLSTDDIAERLQTLTGDVLQQPPRFSAIKTAGKRAYARARRGETVELPPRPVRIVEISPLGWRPPRLRLLVRTGPGVYIRALARDIGRLLDSAAYLHALVRLSSGQFRLTGATRLEGLTREELCRRMLPPDCVVESLPAIVLPASDERRARHGGAVHVRTSADQLEELTVRLYGESGRFIGLGRLQGNTCRPARVLEPLP